MPKRPRSHQLEDESRTLFRQKLPHQWIFRDTTPDYGIDAEVEIFDKNGVSTGMFFKVQLKATDKSDITTGFRISLSQETWNYYLLLKIPVLIVRYHSPSNSFYTRWAHTFDPYYRKGKGKNIIFQFAPNDKWKENTAERLSSQVEAIRNISSAEMKLPIKVALVHEDNEISDVPVEEILAAIRKHAVRVQDIIEISLLPPSEPHTFIKLGHGEILISLAGRETCVLHIFKSVSAQRARKEFPLDALLGVGIAFHILGQSNVGARFVSQFTENSGLVKDHEALSLLVDCLTRAHRITEALTLSEKILREKGSTYGSILFSLPAFIKRNSRSLSHSEKEFYKRSLERQIQYWESNYDPGQLACAHYNLANFVGMDEKNLRLALCHYRQAAKFDPLYWERGYFLREMGGLLFLKRRYQASAHYYDLAANKNGKNKECQALYADALFHAGRYKDAQNNFNAFIESNPNTDPEWRLKAMVLPTIRSIADNQKRQPTAAIKLLANIENTQECKSKEQLEEVLLLDALCSLAWYRLGQEKLRLEAAKGKDEIEAQDTTEMFICFLIAALITQYNLGVWFQLIFSTTLMEREYRESWLADIVILAYRSNGEVFLEELPKVLSLIKEEELSREIQNKIFEIIESAKSKPLHVPAMQPSAIQAVHLRIK